MLIRDIMTEKVLTVSPETEMLDASHILKENRIRHLCVSKGDRLVGVLTDSDLKEAGPSDATGLSVHEITFLLTKVQVKEIMSKDPVTIGPDRTVEEASLLMLKHHISCLPVLNRKDLVGIVTETDIFKALSMLTGIHQGGVKFGLELKDEAGSIKEATDIMRAQGGRLVSIMTSYENARDGFRNVYIRVKGLGVKALEKVEDELRDRCRVLYVTESPKREADRFDTPVASFLG